MENKWKKKRLAFVEPWCKHWICCSWQKDMSLDKATLNSEEIKPVALAISELCLSEGITQSIRQLVNQQKILLNKHLLKITAA